MSKSKFVKKTWKFIRNYGPAVLGACIGVNTGDGYSPQQYQPAPPPVSYQPYYIVINNQPPQYMQNPWMNLMPQMAVTQNMPYGQIPYQQPLMFGQPPQYSAMSPVPQYQSQSIPPELPPQY